MNSCIRSSVIPESRHWEPSADQMHIDFSGDGLEVVDEMTGETKKAEIFVALLLFSHYTYCEAVWSQHKEDLIWVYENYVLF